MMEFRTVKIAIQEILGDAANGRFRVVGYQKQSKNAGTISGNNRLVQVYYTEGQFPKNNSRQFGSKTHEITIDIDISCSAHAQGDISVLESETSTSEQKATALLAIKTAAELADNSVDEVIEYVYQILMDTRNIDAGLPVGTVTNRWIDRIQKDTVLESGALVVKTANMKYTCRLQEDVSGDIGNEPETVIINSDITSGETSGAGVLVENDNL